MRRCCTLLLLLCLGLGSTLTSTTPAAADIVVPAILKTARLTVSTSATSPAIVRGWREMDATDIADYYVATVSRSEVTLDVRGGVGTMPLQMLAASFSAPMGEQFRAGQHTDGERSYPDALFGTVSFGSMACDGVQLTVVDAAGSGDQLTRLDIRFAGSCASIPFFAGELVLGGPTSPVLVANRAPGWFETPVGTTSPTQTPLWYRNLTGSAKTVGRATLSGAMSDFTIITDGCSGRRLAPRAGCPVLVTFSPTVAGPRVAQLALTVGDTSTRTPLVGTGTPGRTMLSMISEPGDYVGGGRRYLVTDAQYPIDVRNGPRDRTSAMFTAQTGADAPPITVQIGLDGGLRTGTFTTGSEPGDAWLDVTAQAASCAHPPGSLTIRQVAFAADNALTRLDASFVQRCIPESPDKTLRGTISYRATTPAPALIAAPFVLKPGQVVTAQHPLTNLTYGLHTQRLVITSTGRAAITFDGKIIWQTPAAGAGSRLTLRSDGSLAVLSKSGRSVWTVKPRGTNRAAFLELQTDGDLALYSSNYQRLWHSGSAQLPSS